MKSQSIYSSLLLCILTFTHFLTISAELCIDFPNPSKPYERVAVECPPTQNNDSYVKRETTNFFRVYHTCNSNAALCNKIKIAFDDAGKEISKVLKLKQIIYVKATFANFYPQIFLGAADSTRYIPLTSDDKIIRRYPQALVKQFSLDVHPAYNDFDIYALFNSAYDWWFRTDDETIKYNQYDFYSVVLHELIHGLGFASSWSNNLENSVNQDTTGLTPTYSFYGFYGNQFTGFTERIFDRYVKFMRNSVVSTSTYYTYQLNEAVPSGTPFNTNSEFVTEVKSSPQWKFAEYAFESATTNYSLYFSPAKDTSWNEHIYLESGLQPYDQGSSISHVSKIYELTEDFLMTHSSDPGVTLEYLIQKGGNYKSPIGPRILSVLESMGYETDAYPNPIKPTYEY
ncbi:hypothetical protein Glove_553g39 [Diversispora epigaea]|uniref:Sequence orphan n=1 Tax=Diversispora epigaea TaxID=1348612 RepID=A0A397GF65_9GLOM|nr:hypothetical protein Glove_553g39 [Diversispora epigaea]